MFCSKCGAEISDEAVICVHCGASVTPANSNPPPRSRETTKRGQG